MPIVTWLGSRQTEPYTLDYYEFQASVHSHSTKLTLKPQKQG